MHQTKSYYEDVKNVLNAEEYRELWSHEGSDAKGLLIGFLGMLGGSGVRISMLVEVRLSLGSMPSTKIW